MVEIKQSLGDHNPLDVSIKMVELDSDAKGKKKIDKSLLKEVGKLLSYIDGSLFPRNRTRIINS